MKRFLSIILIVLLAVCCFSGCEKEPQETLGSDFEYNISENNGGYVSITGYMGHDKDIIIPAKIAPSFIDNSDGFLEKYLLDAAVMP